MTEAHAAVGLERLPWLTDEPKPRDKPPRSKSGARELLGWVFAGVFLVAGVSYWMGVKSIRTREPAASVPMAAPETTIALPAARSAGPEQPAPARAQEVEPIVAPPIPIVEEAAPEPAVRRPHDKQEKIGRARPKAKARTRAPKPTSRPVARKPVESGYWPARVVEGASGRLIRIGTFRTSRQAKKGWWAIMRINPALKRLPAVVVPVQSLRNGYVYYRLQMGTTSQAHSTILCQRMRMIGQSCVVIGLSRGGEIGR